MAAVLLGLSLAEEIDVPGDGGLRECVPRLLLLARVY